MPHTNKGVNYLNKKIICNKETKKISRSSLINMRSIWIDAVVQFAHMFINIGAPSRTEIAEWAFEARILLALVTQMSRQISPVSKWASASIDTNEFFARFNAMLRQVIALGRVQRGPYVARIIACNKNPLIDDALSC